jgi:hypothetical protein
VVLEDLMEEDEDKVDTVLEECYDYLLEDNNPEELIELILKVEEEEKENGVIP